MSQIHTKQSLVVPYLFYFCHLCCVVFSQIILIIFICLSLVVHCGFNPGSTMIRKLTVNVAGKIILKRKNILIFSSERWHFAEFNELFYSVQTERETVQSHLKKRNQTFTRYNYYKVSESCFLMITWRCSACNLNLKHRLRISPCGLHTVEVLQLFLDDHLDPMPVQNTCPVSGAAPCSNLHYSPAVQLDSSWHALEAGGHSALFIANLFFNKGSEENIKVSILIYRPQGPKHS